jgi:signal transduction histidine kinase
MKQWGAFWNNQSLSTRLIVWFLLISLLPLSWITIISYELCKKILFDQAIKHLQVLTLRQELMLNFYFHEKKLDARDFIRDRTTLEATLKLDQVLTRYGKDSPEYEQTKQKFYPTLKYRLQALDYQNLFLVTKSGKIVFSFLPFPTIGDNLLTMPQYKSFAEIFERSRDSLEMDMTSFIVKPDQKGLEAFISIPLLDSNNQLVGCAIVELDTSSIYRFFANFKELGILVDSLLVIKVDDKLFMMSPSTAQPEYHQEIDPNSSLGKFIQQVLTHQHLVSINVEFQGQKTLIAGRRFENAFNWALITKINQDELLAPIHRLKYLFWILVSTTAFAVILAASNVARKIASPILMLTDKTKILAAGDLSQRIKVASSDEIGRLAQSFNDMAAKLDHIIKHLDDLVAKRTREYEIQNVKLEDTIKELRQTRDRLIVQEKLASLGALTAGIAHEIKNPLNFINNFAELCMQLQVEIVEKLTLIKPYLSEKDLETLSNIADTLKLNLSKIQEHGKRADSIVHNMLQHSRGMPGERMKVNIHKLLDEYSALSYHGMRAQDPTFNVNIEKHYDPSVPVLEIVPQEMSRVFLNLLNNAYYSVHQKKKQSSDVSYQPTVIISTEYQKDFVLIKIRDNGVGIPSEVLPKLFTPFFTTKPTGEGTGLGLSLSYNIVVQGHGGTLSANSIEGEFAEFIINLPYIPEYKE